MAKAKKQTTPQRSKTTACVGDATLLPLLTSPMPARWAGRLSKLSVQLSRFLLPLADPHLAKLQTGEVQKCSVFVPKIGVFTLERKGEEIFVTFQNALSVACQRLQLLRLRAIATKHNTVAKSPEGGYWFWMPQQTILPPKFQFSCECITLGLLQQRSPPLWQNEPYFEDRVFEQIIASMTISPARWIAPETLAPSAPPALPRVAG